MIDRAHLEALKANQSRSAATFEPSSWDEETNSIGVLCYTGAEVVRYNYDEGRFYLSFDLSGMDLTRYNAGAAVLKDHSDHSVDNQIGKIMEGSAKITKDGLTARVQFSANPIHAGLIADIKKGIVKNLSIGVAFEPEDLEYVSRKGVAKAERTHIRALKSMPYELSFLPMGADKGAQTLAPATPVGDPPMSTKYEPTAEDLAKIKSQTLAEARERRRAILETARIVQPLGAAGAKLAEDLIDDESVTVEAARAKLIDHRVQWDEQHSTHGQKGTVVKAGADNDGKLGKLLVKALAQKAGARGALVKLTDEERAAVHERFGNLDPRRIAEQILTERGVKFRHLGDEETFARACSQSDVRMGMERYRDTYNHRERLGEIGTADLPTILGSTAELTFIDAYNNVPQSYLAWCTRNSKADFKDSKFVEHSNFPDLEEVGESGKLVEGTVAETGETMNLKEFGRKISVSRRALINDGWGYIGRLAGGVGYRVAYNRNKRAYTMLQLNSGLGPTLGQDSKSVFHTDHSNVSTGALNAANLGVLRKVLKNQVSLADKEGNTDKLNLPLAVVLVPTDLEFAVEQLISSAYVPTASTTVMPQSLRNLTYVSDAHLTSAVAYWGFADPNLAPVFKENVLGDEGMLIDQIYDEETRGMAMLVRIASNFQPVGYRGAVRSTGA